MPVIISAILGIVSSVIGNISKSQQDKIAVLLAQNQQITDLLKAQAEINKIEAANPSLFVAGWRPFVGWICALSFSWTFFIQPILTFVLVSFGQPAPVVPELDMNLMMYLLTGMLGIAGLRTYEKTKGLNGN